MKTSKSNIYKEQFEKTTLKVAHKKDNIYTRLLERKSKVGVVGLGYVGLPLALEFGKYFSIVGFDVNEEKLRALKKGEDITGEVCPTEFANKDVQFTSNKNNLAKAQFYVVAVPTPINVRKKPDLRLLKKATKTVAECLKPGDYVVFESTVYPGCTEEVCVPILEKYSGLRFNIDFKVGYSPERINPGDKENTIATITKVLSGSDEEALEMISSVYKTAIAAGVHEAPSIKVAEASKVVENTQRDINIALMNELKVIFDKLGIHIDDVLKAAGTKWNFLNFFPGLVGGHCIGVDPYYLIDKAKSAGMNPMLISASRSVNENMITYTANAIIEKARAKNNDLRKTRILFQGITYKENVADIRNSKAAEVAKELLANGLDVAVEDPIADAREVKEEYGIDLIHERNGLYDIVVVAVPHDEFATETEKAKYHYCKEDVAIIDLRGNLKNKIQPRWYATL